jgi:hypothetical protein
MTFTVVSMDGSMTQQAKMASNAAVFPPPANAKRETAAGQDAS